MICGGAPSFYLSAHKQREEPYVSIRRALLFVCALRDKKKELRRKSFAMELLHLRGAFVLLLSVRAVELTALDILSSELALYLLVVD